MTKVVADKLSRCDAIKIAKWWNANSKSYYFKRKMQNGNFWEVYRQDEPTNKEIFNATKK